MYGLSGASGNYMRVYYLSDVKLNYEHFIAGRHCCVWCDITSEQMQISQDQSPHSQLRTLESLQSDHASFVADGGDLKKAKLHNNMIRPHFFNIPLSQHARFNSMLRTYSNIRNPLERDWAKLCRSTISRIFHNYLTSDPL